MKKCYVFTQTTSLRPNHNKITAWVNNQESFDLIQGELVPVIIDDNSTELKITISQAWNRKCSHIIDVSHLKTEGINLIEISVAKGKYDKFSEFTSLALPVVVIFICFNSLSGKRWSHYMIVLIWILGLLFLFDIMIKLFIKTKYAIRISSL